MQPLAATLAGYGTGTWATEATRNIVGVWCAAPVRSSCSRAGFVRWNSQGIAGKTIGGSHAVTVAFPSTRHSLRAAAAAEEEAVDLLTLEAPAAPQAEREQESAAEDGSIASKEDTPLKSNVNVKFVLQKQCHFGQQFNVVGEIPELGEWDPSQAVPMVWSEDHVWSAEVPIKVCQTVKYKFLLTGKRAELVWQPGEDKVFETTDENDITVTGSWEEPIPEQDFPSVTSAEAEVVAEDDSEEQEEAPSMNGVATASADSDLREVAVVAEAAADEDTSTEEISDSIDAVSAVETEQEEEAEESPEIPVVDAALATVVAEVSGEVADAAAAKKI